MNRKLSDFWNIVNLKTTSKSSTLSIDPKMLLVHFKRLNMVKVCGNLEPTNATNNCLYVPELDDNIESGEVMLAIKSMKSGKSPGDDGIPPGVYKVLNERLVNLLTILFNRVLRTGEYPALWSTGVICPIHKAGAKWDINNYRGITLLNCIGKLFTTVLCNRLNDWVGMRGLLPETHFGFRKNRRTTDCLFILNSLIQIAKLQKRALFACFVDFSKAFDNVNHNLLWNKLVTLGISQQCLKVIQTMYLKAVSRVTVSRCESTEPFPCQKGVRQGCNLSPLLFSLFISDLESEVLGNHDGAQLNDMLFSILMFADDIFLLSSSVNGLRKHLSSLQMFCHKCNLRINTEKTIRSAYLATIMISHHSSGKVSH